jgi:PleD family two-component response regulator
VSEGKPYLEGKRILAVDDEGDVLATIEDILKNADVDKALDYNSALDEIFINSLDRAFL